MNVHKKITPFDVSEILNRAFVRVATMEKAQKGFEISGIVPYRPNIFTDEDFLPSTLSNIPAVELQLPETELTPCTSETNRVPSKDAVLETNEPNVIPSTSKANEAHADVTPSTSKSGITNERQGDISIEEMTPLCVITENKLKNRGRKLGISKILTATPEKIELEQKENRKIQKKEKQKLSKNVKHVNKKIKRVTRKVFDDSSSSGSSLHDEMEICNDHSSDDPSSDVEEGCIYCGEYGKSEMWYRCGVCHKWAHKECSGYDNHKSFICDYCK
ncbi:uncharacterized protein LOC126887929 isoform X2 [Diabrotica virgifera virgifera]|uniref:Zinc finger PHD-type domain-containing protein n=1 Tax=Diabrotica virgifera virgifera TaxID=50390 RepID=A0ABM5KKY7_DIAVI|nr:uncharacterized protein LOC126887395 isoform X2 [Diabrotica virgifera virgifera]XP_050511811.1 uncharacterized protein LOC126887929 isoform X2 [Diabrotica virgifera virgifera]